MCFWCLGCGGVVWRRDLKLISWLYWLLFIVVFFADFIVCVLRGSLGVYACGLGLYWLVAPCCFVAFV